MCFRQHAEGGNGRAYRLNAVQQWFICRSKSSTRLCLCMCPYVSLYVSVCDCVVLHSSPPPYISRCERKCDSFGAKFHNSATYRTMLVCLEIRQRPCVPLFFDVCQSVCLSVSVRSCLSANEIVYESQVLSLVACVRSSIRIPPSAS